MVDGGARSALVIITISTIINKEGERTKEEGGRRILKMVNGNHKLLSPVSEEGRWMMAAK